MYNKKRISNLIIFILSIALLSSLLIGCEVTVREVTFDKDTYTILVGETFTPIVKTTPGGQHFTLQSDNTTIARVANSKSIIGLREGLVYISAFSQDKTATARVTVLAKPSEVDPDKPKDMLTVFFVSEWLGAPSQQVTPNSYATNVVLPSTSGYEFCGWYKDKELKTPFDFTTQIIVDTYLYAKWLPGECEFVFKPLGDGRSSVKGIKYVNIPYEMIEIPARDNVGNPVVSIEAEAFMGNKLIKGVTIANTIEIIGKNAFSGCTSLENITILEGSALKTIREGAFFKCENVKNIDLPDSVAEIEKLAFARCTKLVAFNIPPKLTIITAEMLSYTGIKSISLKNITKLEQGAFYQTSSLVEIKDYIKLENIASLVFTGTSWIKNELNKARPESELATKGVAYLGTNLIYIEPTIRQIKIKPTTTYIASGAIIEGSSNTIDKTVFFETAKPPRVEKDSVISNSIPKKIELVCDKAYGLDYSTRFTPFGPCLYTRYTEVPGLVAFSEYSDTLKIVLHRYTGSAATLDLVSKLQGYTILKIKAGFMSKLSTIKSVMLYGNIRTIQSGAFNDCANLSELKLYGDAVPQPISSTSFGVLNPKFKVAVPSNLLKKYQDVWKISYLKDRIIGY